MGRTKAQFIANAILHYIHCSQTPDIHGSFPIDYGGVETIVRRVLKEEMKESKQVPIAEPKASDTKNIRKSDNTSLKNIEDILDSDGLEAIADTMSTFRLK